MGSDKQISPIISAHVLVGPVAPIEPWVGTASFVLAFDANVRIFAIQRFSMLYATSTAIDILCDATAHPTT